MKKYFLTLAAVAFLFATGCEKPATGGNSTENPDTENPSTENPSTELPNTLTYGGVTYKTVTLSDGTTWMAEPLRFIPEGITPSSDPTSGVGVYNPYTSQDVDGTITTTPSTDEELIKTNGYLYSLKIALGAEITAENAKSLEGTQGICPDGWHIPTFTEYLNLVGQGPKLSNAAVGSWEQESTPENKDAVFYNVDYKGGMASEMTDFNFVFTGSALPTMYMKGTSAAPTKPMTYIWGSTVYNLEAKTLQFLSLMSTTNATYPNGRITVSFNNMTNACQVRCVKNAQ